MFTRWSPLPVFVVQINIHEKNSQFKMSMTWSQMAQSKVFIVQRNIIEKIKIEIVQNMAANVNICRRIIIFRKGSVWS
jgi:hypothetical protein